MDSYSPVAWLCNMKISKDYKKNKIRRSYCEFLFIRFISIRFYCACVLNIRNPNGMQTVLFLAFVVKYIVIYG